MTLFVLNSYIRKLYLKLLLRIFKTAYCIDGFGVIKILECAQKKILQMTRVVTEENDTSQTAFR